MYSSSPLDLTIQLSLVKMHMEHVDTLDDEAKSAIYHTIIELSKDVEVLLKIVEDLDGTEDLRVFQECMNAMGLILGEVGKDLITMALHLKEEASH